MPESEKPTVGYDFVPPVLHPHWFVPLIHSMAGPARGVVDIDPSTRVGGLTDRVLFPLLTGRCPASSRLAPRLLSFFPFPVRYP